MKRFVYYMFDPEDSFGQEQGLEIGGLRIAVTTPTVRRMGSYQAQLRVAREALAKMANVTVEELPKLRPFPPDLLTPNEYFTRWARMIVVTTGVSICDKGQELDTAAWRESALETLGLDKPEGVFDMPTILFDAWDQAVTQVSEGVFGEPETPEQKKSGKISAT